MAHQLIITIQEDKHFDYLAAMKLLANESGFCCTELKHVEDIPNQSTVKFKYTAAEIIEKLEPFIPDCDKGNDELFFQFEEELIQAKMEHDPEIPMFRAIKTYTNLPLINIKEFYLSLLDE